MAKISNIADNVSEGANKVGRTVISAGSAFSTALDRYIEETEYPMSSAAYWNDTDKIKALYQRGYSVIQESYIDKVWISPVEMAAKHNSSDAIKTIYALDTYKKHNKSQYESAMLYAAKENNFEALKTLKSLGFDINTNFGKITDDNRFFNRNHHHAYTPLGIAIKNKNLKLAESIISIGGNINITDYSGSTAINAAVNSRSTKIVSYFLDKNLDINKPDKYGSTPLHSAAINGDHKMVEYLLSRGANANARTEDGLTPAHFAAQCGYPKVIKALAKKGNANLEAKNKNGETPLHRAKDTKTATVIQDLINGSKIKREKTAAANQQKDKSPQKQTGLSNRLKNASQIALTSEEPLFQGKNNTSLGRH